MPSSRTVAILIVCYNGKRFLDDCLSSVLAANDSAVRQHVIVFDNASTDGSADYVAERYPAVELIRSETNRGFTGGNNAAWDYVQQTHPEVDYIALLNQDTIVETGWLVPLVRYLDEYESVGSVQPLIMLHPQTHLINTAGNRSHYLGFGFVTMLGEPDPGKLQPHPIDYCSGAACVVRASLLRELGLFNEDLFMYLEDAELGWKIRLAGLENHVVPSSRIYHKYTGDAPTKHYYYLERNRWILLLTFYKWRTLLLLSPALIAMEAGQFGYAATRGLLSARLSVVAWWLRAANRRRVWAVRRRIVRRRTDSAVFGNSTGKIDSVLIPSTLSLLTVNYLFGAYWSAVRRLILW